MKKNKIILKRIGMSCGIMVLMIVHAYPQTPSKSLWHGFEKDSLTIEGRGAYIVKPKQALPGNPWVWNAYFPDWHYEMDSILLSKGFHVAYISCSDMFGSPRAMQAWESFYQYLINRYSFAKKTALEGVSRGGLYVFNWAKRNPEKVSCIYAETPVLDIKSWPGGKGKGRGSSDEWIKCKAAYSFNEQQALDFNDNPIDNIEGLAAYHIPVIDVVSAVDSLCPITENTSVFARKYLQLGGTIKVDTIWDNLNLSGHHFDIKNPQYYADFIVQNAGLVKGILPSSKFIESNGTLSLVKYVNPFIGASTDGGTDNMQLFPGKTYPGAATPYGLVQLSPNTVDGGDNAPGYSYEHTSMEGFSFTAMSGVGWYGDLGNFLVMPTTGPMKTLGGRIEHPDEGWRSAFSKKSEQASAGYYSVMLDKYKVKVEATAAPHSGILRFTFPANRHSRIQIDLARRVGGTSVLQYVKLVNDHTIEGWMKCTPDGGGWGNGDGKGNYTIYFYAEFSKPLKNFGIWSADIPDGWARKRDEVISDRYVKQIKNATIYKGLKEKEGKHLGFYSEFATKANEQVFLKSGISFVSMEGAKGNLNAEISDWDFDAIHQTAQNLWNRQLSKIAVQGGTEDEKTIFYTAMYHTMLDPRSVEDVDGNYTGGDNKIHRGKGFTKRSIFSGWDVFRSQVPLQTLINPTLVNDLVNSLVTLADESCNHYLERWEFLNSYSGCMLGNPALPVIADAYAKGIRGYDMDKTYQYAVNSCEKFGNGDRGYAPEPHSISSTLEYAYDEWCLSKLSAELGNRENEAKYLRRSEDYKNVFDPSVGWFRPRLEDGSWAPWPKEGRLKLEYGTIESNPYQQGWFVPQDVPGMVNLMGGNEKVIADLTDMFEKTPDNMVWNNYYNHSNEPVHHIPFLFNRFGAPWLTQKWSREVCKRAYHNRVFGLVGNEDVGQMSAWYVLAASGFHPVCPGDTRYEITSPVFNKITYELDPKYAKGKTFTVIAVNNSPANIYIQSATLNGKPYNHCYLDYNDIIAGGTLQLIMGVHANHKWGID